MQQCQAGYLAKYTTKSTEATGFSSTRITDDTIGQHRPDGNHIDRLIAACWRLGRDPVNHRTGDGGGLHAYRSYVGPLNGPFVQPWDCPDCGTHTRYRACPVCVAERQSSLDTKPTSSSAATNRMRGCVDGHTGSASPVTSSPRPAAALSASPPCATPGSFTAAPRRRPPTTRGRCAPSITSPRRP